MKLRNRPDTKVRVNKKEKAKVKVKKEKSKSSSVKKKKKVRSDKSRKKKKVLRKTTEPVEVIEIPPVVHCAISDVASAMKEATKEELELKEECTILFECNQCDSFFRCLRSYLEHRIKFCCQTTSTSMTDDTVHKVYSWPILSKIKQKEKENNSVLLGVEKESEEDLSDY